MIQAQVVKGYRTPTDWAWCVLWFGRMYPFGNTLGGKRAALRAAKSFPESEGEYSDNPDYKRSSDG